MNLLEGNKIAAFYEFLAKTLNLFQPKVQARFPWQQMQGNRLLALQQSRNYLAQQWSLRKVRVRFPWQQTQMNQLWVQQLSMWRLRRKPSQWTRIPAWLKVQYTFCHIVQKLVRSFRADSRFAPHQWETVLLCNNVSHWLGANLESALVIGLWEIWTKFLKHYFQDNVSDWWLKCLQWHWSQVNCSRPYWW